MHRTLVLSIAMLLTLCALSQTKPAAPGEAALLVNIETEWNRALERGDRGYVENLLSPDLVFTTGRARLVTRAEILDAMKTEKIETSQVSDMDVHLYGGTAVVIGAYFQKGSDGGASFESRGRFTDVFVKRDGNWRVVAIHTSAAPAK